MVGRLIEERLALWNAGDLSTLLRDARECQSRAGRSSGEWTKEQTHRAVSKLVLQGKITAASRLLTERSKGGVLSLDELTGGKSVKEVLLEKHPAPAPLVSGPCVLEGAVPAVTTATQESLLSKLDRSALQKAARETTGAAGVSGVDAFDWRRMMSSYPESDALCDAMASAARRLASCPLDPEVLEGFLACRLIPLDKDPGVRPIGIGEVSRRIIGRAVTQALKPEIREAAGSLQMCAGVTSGCEAGVHALREAFEDDGEAALLVDASNAFNAMNRAVALKNIDYLCPPLARFTHNMYGQDARLFVGGGELLSREGTTQGCPLAMPWYAISMTPLIALAGGQREEWQHQKLMDT